MLEMAHEAMAVWQSATATATSSRRERAAHTSEQRLTALEQRLAAVDTSGVVAHSPNLTASYDLSGSERTLAAVEAN